MLYKDILLHKLIFLSFFILCEFKDYYIDIVFNKSDVDKFCEIQVRFVYLVTFFSPYVSRYIM